MKNEFLKELSKEQLLRLIEDYSKNWLAMDGVWFQSVEDTDICFILIETNTFFKDYNPSIPKRELKVLAVSDEKEMKIFSIVVVPTDPKLSTANLRAPLVVNFEKKLAKQIILDDDTLMIKKPLFESK